MAAGPSLRQTLEHDELPEQLARQLSFLKRSADAYDRGDRDEAYRIAVAIVFLCSDTRRSVSVLQHLSAKNVPLLSTVMAGPRNALFFDGMNLLTFGFGKMARRLLNLTAQAFGAWLASTIGGNEPIFAVNRVETSRKDVVLGAANQDGGAHVDHALDADYERLKEGLYTPSPGAAVDVPEPQLVSLRQMAFEVLNSRALHDLVDYGSVRPENTKIDPPPKRHVSLRWAVPATMKRPIRFRVAADSMA